MGTLYTDIKKVIDEWDPIELLTAHAPSNEYDIESKAIYLAIKDRMAISKNELAKIIEDVFIKHFNRDIFQNDLRECAVIAERILALK